MYNGIMYCELYTVHDTVHVAELPTSVVYTGVCFIIEIGSAVHAN